MVCCLYSREDQDEQGLPEYICVAYPTVDRVHCDAAAEAEAHTYVENRETPEALYRASQVVLDHNQGI